MTRHEMRECIFCLMFQNDFYGTDEFEEQMSNFLANFLFRKNMKLVKRMKRKSAKKWNG